MEQSQETESNRPTLDPSNPFAALFSGLTLPKEPKPTSPAEPIEKNSYLNTESQPATAATKDRIKLKNSRDPTSRLLIKGDLDKPLKKFNAVNYQNNQSNLMFNTKSILNSIEDFSHYWQLPEKFVGFSGRTKQLDQLFRIFTDSNNQHSVIQHSHNNVNPAGTGKTQLAIEFAHRAKEQNLFDQIIWLNAKIANTHNLSFELHYLAKSLLIDDFYSDEEELIEAVYNQLSAMGKTLLIFDDVASFNSIKNFLPKKEHHIILCVTTRDTESWAEGFNSVLVDNFCFEEATNYIQNSLPGFQIPLNEVEELSKALGYSPLALSQATAYIRHTNINLKNYIELFTKKLIQLRSLNNSQIAIETLQEIHWVTLSLCIEHINNPEITKILSCASYLAAGLPIQKNLLYRLVTDHKEPINCVDVLLSHCLIERSKTKEHVKINPMVKEILRLNQSQEESVVLLNKITSAMVCTFQKISDFPVILANYHDHIAHIDSLLEMIPGNHVATEKTPLYQRALLQYQLSLCLINCAKDYDRALVYANLSETCFSKDFPECPIELAAVKLCLAEIYLNKENHQRAEEYCISSHQLASSAESMNLALSAYPLLRLGTINLIMCNFEKAKKHIENAIKILETPELAENIVKHQAMIILAEIQRILGNAYSSLNEYNVVLEKLNLISDDLSLRGIPLYSGYLNSLFNFGVYDKAENLATQLKKIITHHFGSDHLLLVEIQYMLTSSVYMQGNYSTVIPEYLGLIEKAQLLYPKKNNKFSLIYNNVGTALGTLNQYEDSIALIEKSIETIKKYHGPNRAELLIPLRNLATMYANIKNWADVLLSSAHGQFICESIYPDNHNHRDYIFFYLYQAIAIENLNQNSYDLAKNYIEKARAIVERIYTTPEVTQGNFYATVGKFYSDIGDFNQSIDNLQRALTIYQTVLYPGHPDNIEAHITLGVSYKLANTPNLALKEFRTLANIVTKEKIERGAYIKIAESISAVCEIILIISRELETNEYQLVCTLAQKTYDFYHDILPDTDLRVIEARYSLAQYQELSGDFSNAFAGYTQVCSWYKAHPQHTEIAQHAQEQAQRVAAMIPADVKSNYDDHLETETEFLIQLIQNVQKHTKPDCLDPLVLLIETCIAQCHFQKAHELLEISGQLASDERKHLLKAKLYLNMGNFKDAKIALRAAEKSEKTVQLAEQIKKMKSSLCSIKILPVEKSIKSLLSYTTTLREHHQHQESLQILLSCIDEQSDSKTLAAIHYHIANNYLYLENSTLATKHIELSLQYQKHSKAEFLQKKIIVRCQNALLLDDIIHYLQSEQQTTVSARNNL